MPNANLDRDLAALHLQEHELLLPAFTPEIAWQLGSLVRELAVARGVPVAIDIRRLGKPPQPLFYTALPGTTPDNARWIERKANTVARFHRSSYQVGLHLERSGMSLADKYALPEADYATHGGGFPLTVGCAGVVASLTVSGLPQRADHELTVEALCLHLHRDYSALRLDPA